GVGLVAEGGADLVAGQAHEFAGEAPEDGGGRGVIAPAQTRHHIREGSFVGHDETFSNPRGTATLSAMRGDAASANPAWGCVFLRGRAGLCLEFLAGMGFGS